MRRGKERRWAGVRESEEERKWGVISFQIEVFVST
jgi:hypothetical protein